MNKIYLEIELPSLLLKPLDAKEISDFEAYLHRRSNQWTSFTLKDDYDSRAIRKKLEFRDSKLGSLFGIYDFKRPISKNITGLDSILVISILSTAANAANIIDIIQALNYLMIKAKALMFKKDKSSTKNTTIYLEMPDGVSIEISKEMTPEEIQNIIALVAKWDEKRLRITLSDDYKKQKLLK